MVDIFSVVPPYSHYNLDRPRFVLNQPTIHSQHMSAYEVFGFFSPFCGQGLSVLPLSVLETGSRCHLYAIQLLGGS